jgi:hypothetical protein
MCMHGHLAWLFDPGCATIPAEGDNRDSPDNLVITQNLNLFLGNHPPFRHLYELRV